MPELDVANQTLKFSDVKMLKFPPICLGPLGLGCPWAREVKDGSASPEFSYVQIYTCYIMPMMKVLMTIPTDPSDPRMQVSEADSINCPAVTSAGNIEVPMYTKGGFLANNYPLALQGRMDQSTYQNVILQVNQFIVKYNQDNFKGMDLVVRPDQGSQRQETNGTRIQRKLDEQMIPVNNFLYQFNQNTLAPLGWHMSARTTKTGQNTARMIFTLQQGAQAAPAQMQMQQQAGFQQWVPLEKM